MRKNLSELDDYMSSVDRNVMTLNEFVRLQIDALTARGEASHDLWLTSLRAT